MPEYQELTWYQVACSATLIVINIVISWRLDLRLGRPLLWAAIRMVVQLSIIGWVLSWVFEVRHFTWLLIVSGIMTGVAGWTAANRDSHPYPGLRRNTMLAIWCSSWTITACAVWIVADDPRDALAPDHVIPLLGMILGNSLNAVSLTSMTFGDHMTRQRAHVEGLLTLGASRWEATRFAIQRALRTGLTPMVHTMSVVGLVSLPGMMTGQLLAGAPPASAIRYQIVIMFCIASSTALAATGAVLLGYQSLTNRRHQLVGTSRK